MTRGNPTECRIRYFLVMIMMQVVVRRIGISGSAKKVRVNKVGNDPSKLL